MMTPASYRSLRRLLMAVIAGVALTTSASSARADLQATFDGTYPSQTFAIYLDGQRYEDITSGARRFTTVGGSDAGQFPSNFTAFCVDLSQGIAPGGPYQFQLTDPANLPELRGETATKADYLQELFGEHFAATTTASGAAAFQLAVWEILYDDVPGDLTNGYFSVAPGDQKGTAFTSASSWLNALSGDTSSFAANYPNASLVGLVSGKQQDMITFHNPPDCPPTAVPGPAGVVLGAVAGVVGLLSRRRRDNTSPSQSA